ncbi:uncharacterized protein Fot_08558 [Forsythia ovata]|uniref:Uncharacterized protein n=1 Tax=Forsythia ovata TaxID=205694 RepID=A0ABD1WYZ0_9LAMI
MTNNNFIEIGRIDSRKLKANSSRKPRNPLNQIYVFYPMKKLNTPTTTSDMGALFLTTNSAAKCLTSMGSVRILSKCSEKSVLKLNLDGIEEFSMSESQHRLSMCRSKKPLLETIILLVALRHGEDIS